MGHDIVARQIGEWVVRIREPKRLGPHPVLLLLHGWTGDENVMWVFAQRLSGRYLFVAPRGRFRAPLGGYGWHDHREDGWPTMEVFYPSLLGLFDLLTKDNFPSADLSRLDLIGFSQGAALSYAFTLMYPEKISTLAGLSGFMPGGGEALIFQGSLANKPVFIAHGTQDTLVPVVRARQSVALFQEAGAQVTYCEEEVGHKLSARCFRGMEAFFSKHAV